MKVVLPYLTVHEKSKNINPKVAYKIVKKNYCSRMINAGICPANCFQCDANLNEMLNLENAKKPAALLTWIAREKFAIEQEKHSASEKIIKEKSFMDVFSKKSDNPFLNLLAQLEET